MINLKSFIGDNPLLNASGCMCATKAMLDKLVTSDAAGICSKSCTLQPRVGNVEPRYWESADGKTTLNSMGLPNLGTEYYLDYFKKMDDTISGGYWRCLSIAVMDIADVTQQFAQIFTTNDEYWRYIDAIEFNVSCPNLAGKEIIAYDIPSLRETLDALYELIRITPNATDLEYGIKLPPYFQLTMYSAVAALLNPEYIAFIHTINSVPNALIIDPETEITVIHPKNGFGGLGGEAVKPIALANIRGMYLALSALGRSDIKIIGCGGVKSGLDVFEMILAGADVVSVGSQLMVEGPECFARINTELREIMAKKSYTLLSDFRGKLRTALPQTIK